MKQLPCIPADRALEKSATAIAARHAVMFSGSLVTAHFTQRLSSIIFHHLLPPRLSVFQAALLQLSNDDFSVPADKKVISSSYDIDGEEKLRCERSSNNMALEYT